MRENRQRGQTLLIIVLIMVVGLTVGLAVVSRSITNLKTTTDEDNSQRAFSAAEAGIEAALKSGSGNNLNFINNNAKVTTVSSPLSGRSLLIAGGNIIDQDEGADVWLVAHKADGSLDYTSYKRWDNLTIYWGKTTATDCENPAIELIIISNSSGSLVSDKRAYDPCSGRRGDNNLSTNPSTGSFPIGVETFKYSTGNDIGTITNGIMIRVIPLYSSAMSMGVTVDVPDSALPVQGSDIQATGVSGNTTRKVKYFQGFPSLPNEFFQYVLFLPK